MRSRYRVFGFGGSLRKESYTAAVLRAAPELAPEGMDVEVFADLAGIPIFNQDLEKSPPPAVADFKDKIKAADGILICTPEYNYSMPGYLKNAIDWASRPYGDNSFNDKPVAIMSASNGILGGSRAQYPLRQTFVFLNMHPVNYPEVIIPQVAEKLVNGKLTDEHTKEKITELLLALRHLINIFKHV